MVNTRTRAFHMLIPANVRYWERLRAELALVWKYDRANLPRYLVERTWNTVKSRQQQLRAEDEGSDRHEHPPIAGERCEAIESDRDRDRQGER